MKSLCQLGCYVNQIVTEENIEGRVPMMQSETPLGFPSDLRNGEFLQFKATSVTGYIRAELQRQCARHCECSQACTLPTSMFQDCK